MVIIRQADVKDASEIAKIYVDGWRTTYPEIVPEKFLENMSYENYTAHWKQILSSADGFFYIAEDESREIVGFIWGGQERTGDPVYKGEVHAIYVRKTYQGKGVGRRLIRSLVEKLLQAGIRSMLLWVLEENHPARRFYETLGGQQVRTGPYAVGEVTLEDIAYGWTDITILLQ